MTRSNFAPKRVVFDDVLYRSLTEGRTAVFFAYAKIAYQYEPSTFKLSNGREYTPDFYLPDYDTFVEVKPGDKFIRDQERFKADLLAAEGKNVWLTYGAPQWGVWFEHIGVSEYCMIANDNDHANSHWKLHADSKGFEALGSGLHVRPRLPHEDLVMQLALSQSSTFEPREEVGISIGEATKTVLQEAKYAEKGR